MVLVDSSVWIETARRDGSADVKCALEGLLEEFEAALCGLVVLEVLGGARPEERGRLQAYLSVLPRLPTPEATWDRAAVESAGLRQRGLTVPWSDLLVATVAVMQGVRVYAADRHFDLMAASLSLRLYEPGYGGRFSP